MRPDAHTIARSGDLELADEPEDEVWYFVFGSNVHDSAFRERLEGTRA